MSLASLHSISSSESSMIEETIPDNSILQTSRLLTEGKLKRARENTKTQKVYLRMSILVLVAFVGLIVGLYFQTERLNHQLELKAMEMSSVRQSSLDLRETLSDLKRDYANLQREYEDLTEHLVNMAEKEEEKQGKSVLNWVASKVNNEWIQKQVNSFKEALGQVWTQMFNFYDKNAKKLSNNARVLMMRLKNLTRYAS